MCLRPETGCNRRVPGFRGTVAGYAAGQSGASGTVPPLLREVGDDQREPVPARAARAGRDSTPGSGVEGSPSAAAAGTVERGGAGLRGGAARVGAPAAAAGGGGRALNGWLGSGTGGSTARDTS